MPPTPKEKYLKILPDNSDYIHRTFVQDKHKMGCMFSPKKN